MQCKELQTKIAVRETLTPDERHHAESCPECLAFASFDDGLNARLAEWRVADPLPRRRAIPMRTGRFALAGVSLAAALGLTLLVLPARSDAKQAYGRMMLAIRQVRSVHLIVRWRPGNGNPEDGPLRKVSEIWWQPGALREEYAGSAPTLKREENGVLTFYRYDPASERVQAATETAVQPDYRTFDLAKFASAYMATPTRFEQPTPDTIVTTNAEGWSRMVFTLDRKTCLPTHADKQFRRGKEWLKSGELDMAFDTPIPEDRFDPASLEEKTKP